MVSNQGFNNNWTKRQCQINAKSLEIEYIQIIFFKDFCTHLFLDLWYLQLYEFQVEFEKY